MKKTAFLLSAYVCMQLAACKVADDNSVKADLLNCPANPSALYGFGGRGPIAFPNAFSPNGDGRNDVLRLIANDTGVVRSVNMRIVAADGTVLHTISKQDDYWDGYNRNAGKHYPPGQYRVDYGIVLHGGSGSDAVLNGHTCIKLYASRGDSCLAPIGNTHSDVFGDMIEPETGNVTYQTAERFCR